MSVGNKPTAPAALDRSGGLLLGHLGTTIASRARDSADRSGGLCPAGHTASRVSLVIVM